MKCVSPPDVNQFGSRKEPCGARCKASGRRTSKLSWQEDERLEPRRRQHHTEHESCGEEGDKIPDLVERLSEEERCSQRAESEEEDSGGEDLVGTGGTRTGLRSNAASRYLASGGPRRGAAAKMQDVQSMAPGGIAQLA